MAKNKMPKPEAMTEFFDALMAKYGLQTVDTPKFRDDLAFFFAITATDQRRTSGKLLATFANMIVQHQANLTMEQRQSLNQECSAFFDPPPIGNIEP